MKSSILFAGMGIATLVAVWAGCAVEVGAGTGALTTTSGGHTSSSGSTHTGGGSTGMGGHGTSSGSMSSSGTMSSSGMGGMAANPFECTIPAAPPSKGSCVTTVAANDAGTGIECNPVTNAGCTGTDTCDINTDSSGMNIIGFVCYTGPSTDPICAMCDDMTAATSCNAGMTCYPYDENGDSVCAQYCCTDSDCGSGKCATVDSTNATLFGPLAPKLGVCVAM